MVPARNVETASNVTIVFALPFHGKLPSNMVYLNIKLQDLDVYVPMDVNHCIEGVEPWQRFYFLVVFAHRVLAHDDACVILFCRYKCILALSKGVRSPFHMFSCVSTSSKNA